MSMEADFARAQQDVKTLTKTPDNSTLLKLYGLYKQGKEGDVSGSRPGALNFKGRAKWDAWATLKGTAPERAQADYVQLVQGLLQKQ